jgi:hypothetical protein
MTRIPTHDNNGRKFRRAVLREILSRVRDAFGGYSLDGPGLGAWTDDAGNVYEEHSYVLTVIGDRNRFLEARELVIAIGRELGQLAMYFEIRDADGIEIIDLSN